MRTTGLRTGLTLILACVLAFVIGCRAADRCYFCVVPKTLPCGEPSGEARRLLEDWFCQQAGGFTCWPQLRGGWMDGEVRTDEDNVGYLVVGGPPLGPRIEAMIRQQFGQKEAFVISWPIDRQQPPISGHP